MNILRNLATDITTGQINFQGPKDDSAFLGSLLSTVYFWVGAVAVIVIVMAGFMYVTSQGNSTQTAKAKNMILGSVIGIIVVMMAFVITNFVINGVSK
ncbi:MAG: hypothetical protein WBB94_01645 [Candidatus Saccharimonadaceae bacterium]